MNQVRVPRMRQIHLDFHTSGDIENIARDFNAEAFAETLEQSHVDGVTLFSRCHHGYLYYPSTYAPERVHPHLLRKDLLGEQMAACTARGIAVCIYLPLQWDRFSADEHPEWLVMDAHGKIAGNEPYEPGFYNQLCLNTPYMDWVIGQAEEVVRMYRPHGVFLDIINSVECSCIRCRRGMLSLGLDPSDKKQRIEYRNEVVDKAMELMSAKLRAIDPALTIFYNHSHVRYTHRNGMASFTHLELESLPSGGWGYWDYPLTVRYARTFDVPTVGMTGKFQTFWGDFHSLKTKASLEYECFRNLAFGSACSVGDQLHPWGVLDKRSYSLIGQVYEAVETKEPWCVDASPVLEIGLVHPDGFDISAGHGLNPAAVGAVRMLQELSWQFDVIDGDADFTKYRVIVVPDAAALDDQAIGRLQKFCEKGGKVLSSAWALIDRNTGLHALENRIHVTGDAEYEPDFIVAPFVSGMGNDEHVMYFRGVRIEPDDGLEVLAWVNKPAFNRTWKHYCSHRHAPSLGERVYPGIVTGPSIIHCMHPVFTTYTQMDVSWYKALVDACLKRFIINPVVRHDGPSSLVVLVNRQVEERRYVVHMLHYIPERRGQQFDVVHDVIPLHDITLVLNLPVTPARARLVPDGLDLNVRAGQDGSVSLTVPEFSGHCMMELLYEELA